MDARRECHALSSAVTYAGVSGILRACAPVASKNAAHTAGGQTALAASEPPPETTVVAGELDGFDFGRFRENNLPSA